MTIVLTLKHHFKMSFYIKGPLTYFLGCVAKDVMVK